MKQLNLIIAVALLSACATTQNVTMESEKAYYHFKLLRQLESQMNWCKDNLANCQFLTNEHN